MVKRYLILALIFAAAAPTGCHPTDSASAQRKLAAALADRQQRQTQSQQLYAEGLALLGRGKDELAAGKFRAAVEADDRHAGAWVGLGVAAYRQEDWATALGAFDRARSLAPHRPEPHYNLALTLEAMGQYSRAMECYERALKISPDHLEAAENLVRCLVVTRLRPQRALELAQKALGVETRPQWRDWLTLQTSLLQKRQDRVVMNSPPERSQ